MHGICSEFLDDILVRLFKHWEILELEVPKVISSYGLTETS